MVLRSLKGLKALVYKPVIPAKPRLTADLLVYDKPLCKQQLSHSAVFLSVGAILLHHNHADVDS